MMKRNWKAMRLLLCNKCLTGLLSVLGYSPCSDENEEPDMVAPMYGTPPVALRPSPVARRSESESPSTAENVCEISPPAYAV